HGRAPRSGRPSRARFAPRPRRSRGAPDGSRCRTPEAPGAARDLGRRTPEDAVRKGRPFAPGDGGSRAADRAPRLEMQVMEDHRGDLVEIEQLAARYMAFAARKEK